jgi:hypothetical protein
MRTPYKPVWVGKLNYFKAKVNINRPPFPVFRKKTRVREGLRRDTGRSGKCACKSRQMGFRQVPQHLAGRTASIFATRGLNIPKREATMRLWQPLPPILQSLEK